jgi:hypothetical protein
VICFVAVTAIVMVGFCQVVVSYYMLSRVESDHDAAIDIADAGVNYELNTISANSANADQAGTGNPPGSLYSFGGGTFRVYCENSNGTTPWTPGNSLIVVSTGTVNGAARTVKVTATPVGGSGSNGNYAIYGEGTSVANGSVNINGDVGTNAQLTFNGNVGVTGSVIFNGSGSGWQSNPNKSYTVVHNSNAINWPTVTSIANSTFTSSPGGLAYVAANNDNANYTNPKLTSTVVLMNGNGTQTFIGKPGGSNFYLTSLTTNGNANIYFDNTNGPITIWVGPAGTASTFVFNGGSSAVSMSKSNAYPVRVYVATTNDVIQNGNTELDCGIYNINSSGQGRMIFNGNPTTYGSVICNSFNLNGTPNLNYVSGLFSFGQISYYGFGGVWTEQNVNY